MILSMNSQDLLEGMNIVTRALSPRPARQILEGVLISADNNRVVLTCTDGSLSIEYTNAATVQESGQIVLPGRIFAEMIRKMPSGTVTISEQDNRSATIRCMKNRSSLAVMNPAEYPEIELIKSGTLVKIPQKKLKDMIAAQGGDPAVCDDVTRLPQAKVIRSVACGKAGYAQKMDTMALGMAAQGMGAGRSKVDDELDIYVGNIQKFTALPGASGDSYAVRVTSVIREE